MNCDCSVDDRDYRASCSIIKIRLARKQHTCCECHGTILPGSNYEYVSGVWDKVPMDFKTCMACSVIREDYCPCGAVFGKLAETIEECLGFDYRVVEEGEEGD